MDEALDSPYIKIHRTWRDRTWPVFLAACWCGTVLFASALVREYWPPASSEDQEALRTLVEGVFFAFAVAGASGISHWGSMRGVERAVVELVRRHEPLTRRALLKACRPERQKRAVLLATEQLLAAGKLGHTREGYTVAEPAAASGDA